MRELRQPYLLPRAAAMNCHSLVATNSKNLFSHHLETGSPKSWCWKGFAPSKDSGKNPFLPIPASSGYLAFLACHWLTPTSGGTGPRVQLEFQFLMVTNKINTLFFFCFF